MKIGDKKYHLTLIEKIPGTKKTGQYGIFKCDCGNIKKIRINALTNKEPTKSCGCYRKLNSSAVAKQRTRPDPIKMGDKFNHWTIIHFSHKNKYGSKHWRCVCDCGNYATVQESSLINDGSKSCGCYQKEIASQTHLGSKSKRWTGYGDVSGRLWDTIKTGAKKRNLEFDISIEYIWELFKKQNGKCALTGMDITLISYLYDENSRKKTKLLTTASLDRIDSKRGYTKDNVWWVHKHINVMKNAYNFKEFVSYCIMVARHCKNHDLYALNNITTQKYLASL